jgi:hypothetical protein
MKTLFILFCSILLAPAVALCQGGPVTIMISAGTQPASAGKAAKSYADNFQTQVEKLLRAEYPCADAITTDEVAALVKLKHDQALLGTDTDTGLENLAGAVGAKYLISLTVTDNGSGPVGLNATMMNTANGQTLAKNGTVTSGGEAELDAIEALAKQFVDSLSSLTPFSKSKCNPTNPWAGTITYHLKQTPPADTDTRTAISGNGKGTVTKTLTRTVDDQVSIRVGWTGQPSATIVLNESSNTEEKAIVQMDCGRPTIASQAPDLKSGGWDHVELMEKTAGDTIAAAVSVTIANGRYTIKLNVPEIQGEIKRTLHNHDDGGCGNPKDDNPDPRKYVWDHAMVLLPVIDEPLQKPDTLHITDNDAFGGIFTVDLTRTPLKQ